MTIVEDTMTTAERLLLELNDFREKLNILVPGPAESQLFSFAVDILETAPIQTLKGRLQLGLISEILPSSRKPHSRFEHTVGVVAKCLVACDLINSHAKSEGTLNFNDIAELVVAAALHDCGHLPVSHATERAYFTATYLKKGIRHEERIIPLIVNRNPYFESLRNIVLEWDKKNFSQSTFFRIATIIYPPLTEEYEKEIPDYIRPKKAIQQLLVSDIDMDRLDYITRDASELNYRPVTLLVEKILEYVKGLTLVKYKSLNYASGIDVAKTFDSKKEDVELCLAPQKIENVFYLLVSRVLLYKHVYFSPKVRSFESILTYLVSTLLAKNVALKPLTLIAMTDGEFIEDYLPSLVNNFIDDNDEEKDHLLTKYVNVLKHGKVRRFKLLGSIKPDEIINPRLKEEFEKNINERKYVDNFKNYINYVALKEGKIKFHKTKGYLERSDLLFDVFNLKTGGGDLLIAPDLEKGQTKYQTLRKSMNGSNMHRLCSETRLDIYHKSDMSDEKKEYIKQKIDKFFKEI